MRKHIYFFIILFCHITSVGAQKQCLTLSDCIELASDSSLNAFMVKNMYKASYWQYRTYRAGRLPMVNLRMTPLQYNRNIIKRYDFNENIDIYRVQESLNSSAGLNISQNFDLTGGTFFLDSDLGYMRNFGENTYTQFTTVPFRIGYSQSLFGFNSFKWEKKIEPLKFEQAKKRLIYNMVEIAEEATLYFFNYIQAKEELKLAKETVLSTDTLYKIGLERRRISTISEADIITLELDVINANNELKNIELTFESARSNLYTFLRISKTKDLELVLPEKAPEMNILHQEAVFRMKANNPDYLVNQQELLEAEKEMGRSKKKSAFDASISASVGFNQAADNFASAYKKPLQQDIVTINLTIPILDWGVRKGQVNMARNNLDITRITIEQKEQVLEQELISSINNFNIQQELIKSAQRAICLANSAYNENKQRFAVGRSDINSLTLSLNRKKEVQRTYLNTLRNCWVSYYKIKKLTMYDFEKQQSIAELTDKRIYQF